MSRSATSQLGVLQRFLGYAIKRMAMSSAVSHNHDFNHVCEASHLAVSGGLKSRFNVRLHSHTYDLRLPNRHQTPRSKPLAIRKLSAQPQHVPAGSPRTHIAKASEPSLMPIGSLTAPHRPCGRCHLIWFTYHSLLTMFQRSDERPRAASQFHDESARLKQALVLLLSCQRNSPDALHRFAALALTEQH